MKTLITASCLGIVAMMADVLGFRKFLFPIVLIGLAAAFGLNICEWNQPPQTYYRMMYIDNYAIAFNAIIIMITFLWVLLSKDQYDSKEFNQADQYALVIFSMVGGLCLTSFLNLSMLFIGIEIMSIPLYILAGSRKHDLSSNESSLKYFLMGAFATGILLFGIALIYGVTGHFDIRKIADVATGFAGNTPLIFHTGVLLVIIGLSFKISAVPFHFWTPDVYEGAPTMITGFMATFVKTAAFAAFFKLFSIAFSGLSADWGMTLSVITGLTILAGNIMATVQTSVKRMLAFSGISQAGYLLLTILVLNNQTQSALILYTASYSISTLLAFAILYQVGKMNGSENYEAFNGLGKSHPLMAAVMTIAMLSLAGIPPTVGFFAKFYLFEAVVAADVNNIWIVLLAVLGSLISVYYYFKVIIAMYSGSTVPSSNASYGTFFRVLLVAMAILIILLGISPQCFI